jgi:hypothetical protein
MRIDDLPGSQNGSDLAHHSVRRCKMEGLQVPEKSEDRFTKTIEDYTAAVPSSSFLGIAVGAMALSLLCQVAGQGKWGNFIAQWVPTWLLMGVYNKLVKLEGHDQYDRG